MPVFYVDGQSMGNEQRGIPRRARIAVVYQWSSKPEESKVFWRDVGDKTNNEAEYFALLNALSYISTNLVEKGSGTVPKRIGTITIFSDSELMVKQMKGEYEVREPRLKELKEEASILIERMGSIELKNVRREMNYAGRWLDGLWKGGSVQKL